MRTDLIVGVWKFTGVPPEELCELAQSWANNPGNHGSYTALHVFQLRGNTARPLFGIGFTYHAPSRIEEVAYINRTSLELGRHFGHKFIGWDVASPIWVVK